MNLEDALFDRRIADQAGDAQLVPAGEKDPRRAFERRQRLTRTAVRPFLNIELD